MIMMQIPPIPSQGKRLLCHALCTFRAHRYFIIAMEPKYLRIRIVQNMTVAGMKAMLAMLWEYGTTLSELLGHDGAEDQGIVHT